MTIEEIEKSVEEYEKSNAVLDDKNRLRYAMFRALCWGIDLDSHSIKELLIAIAKPENQTANQIKRKLSISAMHAELSGKELTYDYAEKVLKNFNITLEG